MEAPALRLPKYGAFSFARKALRAVSGFASTDVRRRLDSAQRFMVWNLWKMPRPELEDYLELAERIEDAAFVGSRVYADREAMLQAVPEGGTIAEMGVFEGGFSKLIARHCKPTSLHLIDIDLAPLDEEGVRRAFDGELKTHEGDGPDVLGRFPEQSFDLIYVDADHSYSAVARDLPAAHRVLKRGGMMMCNDYANWCSTSVAPYGVARAVNEFVNREGYSVVGLALQPAGLYDILLRKPI